MIFRHMCFIVKDIKKAEQFYKKNFGLKTVKRDYLTGAYPEKLLGKKGLQIKYVKLKDRLGFQLELIEANKKLFPHLSFTVDNVDSLYKKLKKQNVRFLSEPFEAPDNAVKLCHCKDIDGNLIELVQPLPEE